MFNIGVEGQYRLAAGVVAIAGVEIHLPAVLQIPLLLIIAMAVGAVWAGIAGSAEDPRGVCEVISTIMLNYIAYGLIAFILTEYLSGDASSNLTGSTPDLPAASQMPGMNRLFHNLGLLAPHDPDQITGFLVVIARARHGVLLRRRTFPVRLRPAGERHQPLRRPGRRSQRASRMILITMLISGALAGMVGLPYLLGQAYNYSSEFPRHWASPASPWPCWAATTGRHRLRGAAVGLPRAVGPDPRPQRHPAGDLRPDAGIHRAGRRRRLRDRPTGTGTTSRTRGRPRGTRRAGRRWGGDHMSTTLEAPIASPVGRQRMRTLGGQQRLRISLVVLVLLSWWYERRPALAT